jgi:hypothetical protein
VRTFVPSDAIHVDVATAQDKAERLLVPAGTATEEKEMPPLVDTSAIPSPAASAPTATQVVLDAIWASNTYNDGSSNALRTDYGGPTTEYDPSGDAAVGAQVPTNPPETVEPSTLPVVAYQMTPRVYIPSLKNVVLGITDPATAGDLPNHGPSTIVVSP